MNTKFLSARDAAARLVVVVASLLSKPTAALMAAGMLLGAAQARNVAGVEVPPPLPAGNVSEIHWGTAVPDPYRHLENVKDPLVQQWLRAQADATSGVLARIPGRVPLMERMRTIEASVGGLTQRVVRSDNGRLFFLRRNPGEDQFRLVWRDGPNGRDTVIVDPEALSRAAGQPHAIMDYQPSPDGTKLAYSVQVGGGEIGVLHVVDVASTKPLLEPIDRIRFASASWLADGSGFFYSRLREGYEAMAPTERFADRSRHFRSLDTKLATSQADRVIMSASRNPDLKLPSYADPYTFEVAGTNLAATWISLGVDNRGILFVAEMQAVLRGQPQWRKIFDVEDEVSNFAVHAGALYLKSAKNAPRFQVLRLPLDKPDIGQAQVVMAESDAVIENLVGARDAVYVTRREGANLGLHRIVIGAAGAAPAAPSVRSERIPTPVLGNVLLHSTSSRQDGIVISLGGWAHMSKDYAFDPASGKTSRLPLVQDGAFDAPTDIEAREVMVRSHDGVQVPVSVISRKGLKLDGSNPAIVYGYGAYGLSDEPFFSPRWYAWLARGGVFAIAHVRGGGAFGKTWHDAGRKATKPNTWKDAIAAGQWLVANGYTTSQRMGIFGGSAGGIFVGGAVTQAPALFAAAVPAVGTMDMMRAEFSANGEANIPEFGTIKKEDEFRALLAMSSYHQLRDGVRYPAVMLTHGVNDIRVDVWQSAKFASRLAAINASNPAADKPVLLRLEYEAGHGSGSTRAQALKLTADIWSFFLWQFGVPEFQPPK